MDHHDHGGVSVSVALPGQVEAPVESDFGCHSTGRHAGHESSRQ